MSQRQHWHGMQMQMPAEAWQSQVSSLSSLTKLTLIRFFMKN